MRRYIIESQAGAKIHPFVLLITFYTSNHRIVTDWQFLYFKGSFYVRQSIPPEASLRPVVFPEGGKIGNSWSLHPWQESRVFLDKIWGSFSRQILFSAAFQQKMPDFMLLVFCFKLIFLNWQKCFLFLKRFCFTLGLNMLMFVHSGVTSKCVTLKGN